MTNFGALAEGRASFALHGSSLSGGWTSIGSVVIGWVRAIGLPLGAVVVGVLLGVVVFELVRLLRRHAFAPETESLGPATTVPTTVLPARVWTRDGSREVRIPSLLHEPSAAPRQNARFVLTLVVVFTGVASVFLSVYPEVFGRYDRLVGIVGAFLYWPAPWPGVYGASGGAPLVYDFIFPMYLALILSWIAATSLQPRRARPPAKRWALMAGIVGLYLAAEMVVDALFFTVPGLPVRNLSLIVRALIGGIFLTIVMYLTFGLPAPLARIRASAPRDRRAVRRFFGYGIVAIASSGVGLYFLSVGLQLHGIFPAFTVLLLLPSLALPIWALLNRPAYFRYWKDRPPPSLEEFHPSVSVLIPAFNEEAELREAILSADRASARYPGLVTIVVGNDGSTDRTSEIARAAIAELEHSTGVVLDLPHGGKSQALNSALLLAPGEIVVRLDADSRISERTGFGPAVAYLADPSVGGVQGYLQPRQKDGWPRKLRAMEIAWQHLFLRPGAMGARAAEVIDGAFSVFRRDDLRRLGGWVAWNGEDTELSLRLQRGGYRICIAFGAHGYEDVPDRYATLRKQRIRWTRGGVFANSRNYPALFEGPIEFGGLAILFYYLLVLRAGARSLVFVYLALLTVFLGVPGILHAFYLLLVLLALRTVPLAYFLVRMRRYDVLPWIPLWPVFGIIKSVYRFEAFGTVLYGVTPEFF